MGYKILEIENLPASLKNKPRWVSCMAFTAVVLIVTMLAITIGVLLGYTYCYIEHNSQVNSASTVTQSANLNVLQVPYPDSEDAKYNRTINGAIMSSILMSKILQIGQVMLEDNMHCIPGDEHNSDGL